MSYRKLNHYEVEVITNEPCFDNSQKKEIYNCDKLPTINSGYFIIYAEDGNRYISCDIVKRVNCEGIWEEVEELNDIHKR